MNRLSLTVVLFAGCGAPGIVADPAPTELIVDDFGEVASAPCDGSGMLTVPDALPVVIVEPVSDNFTRFVDRLLGLEDGERERVNIVLVGDSHIASDTLSHRLRVLLQDRYGDGGRGFSYPGEPWDGFRQRRMRYGMDGDWSIENGARRQWEAPVGLGGVRLHSAEAGAQVWRQAVDERDEAQFDVVAVHYVMAPGGGSFDVSIDGAVVATVATGSDTVEAAVFRWRGEAAAVARITLVGDGEVSLLGVATERSEGGIVLDSLGINGARATQFLAFDDAMTRTELEARDPAAYIVAFGTNEAYGSRFRQEADDEPGDADERAAAYATDFGALLDRYAAAAPDAACIVLLPPDFNDDDGTCTERTWSSGGRCNEFDGCVEAHEHEFCVLDAPDSLARVAAAQREAAVSRGCAVWDQLEAMGGPGSHSAWQQWSPPLAAGDGVHLTSAGYDRLAEGFFADLDAAVRLRRAGAEAAVLQTTAGFPPHGAH